MAKEWKGGHVGGRGDRDQPHGWENPRDAEDGGVKHDETRRTDQERYGVQYNVDPDTIGK